MVPHKRTLTAKHPPFRREAGHSVVFDPCAREVSIIDRSGRAVWKKSADDGQTPLRWNGVDALGQLIQSGDYICKLVYPDEKVSYLPFLYVTHP